MLYDELSNKRKWTYASKNTSRALKDQQMNNAYWNILNHVPKEKVSSIVTKRILEMDKKSCDGLLNAIIDEKRAEDTKQNLIQKERFIARNKLALRHN